MSESTASRLDRVGREQRREERQRTATATSASLNLVSSSSSSSPASSNTLDSSFVARITTASNWPIMSNNDDSLDSDKGDNITEDNHDSTSTLATGNKIK